MGRIVFEEDKMAIKLEISSVHGTFSTLNTFQVSAGNCPAEAKLRVKIKIKVF